MKTYNVKITYSFTGYNGHDQTNTREMTVVARNQKSAEKKAIAKLPPYADFRNMFIEEDSNA